MGWAYLLYLHEGADSRAGSDQRNKKKDSQGPINLHHTFILKFPNYLADICVQRQLDFLPANVTSVVAAMGRLVIADADSVRVCSLDGKRVAVPTLPESDGRGGTRPVWKDRIAEALDNPRMMWDGSFLWVAELQLRVTQENQVVTSVVHGNAVKFE